MNTQIQKTSLTLHRIEHTAPFDFRHHRKIRAKVVGVLDQEYYLVRIQGERYRVRSEIPLKKGAVLLLEVVQADEEKVHLRLSQGVRKDYTFIAKLDAFGKDFDLMRDLLSCNRDTKQAVLRNLLSDATQKELMGVHRKILSKGEYTLQNLLFHPSNLGSEEFAKNLHLLLRFLKSEERDEKEMEELRSFLSHLEDQASDRGVKRQIDDIVQIFEVYALLGFATRSYWGFLPINDEQLQENRIIVKPLYKNRCFYCHIHLHFTSCGHIGVSMLLHKTYLHVDLAIEDDILQKKVAASRSQLKKLLASHGKIVHIAIKPYTQDDVASVMMQESFVDRKI